MGGKLGRAPRPSKQSIHVGSDHGACVVQIKEGVKANFFEFPLTYDAASSSLDSAVSGLLEMRFQPAWVLRVLVRRDVGILRHHWANFQKKRLCCRRSVILARSILFE